MNDFAGIAGKTADWLIKSPLTINWALNNSCNFNCKHCYSRVDTAEELDKETLCAAFAKVAKFGVLAVNFGGGEPLLRADIMELAACASKTGLQVSMNSNGFLLDRETASGLKDAGFARTGISIDSHIAETHDNFRGVTGSHGRACAALRHLSAVGIRSSVSTVICRINHTDVDALVDFARDLGALQINFHNFKCSGLGMENRDELDLSPKEWQIFYRKALAAKNKTSGFDISFDDPIIASLGLKGGGGSLVKGSVCGKLSLNIKSNGDITPCGFIPIVIGNIVRDDLSVVWRESELLQKLRHKEPTGKCVSCSSYEECLGGCSARALAVTGDFNNPDPHCWED
jgi:GeoRSP system radical SAM/SPASM protein